MASGIAHDINNALMPIMGFSELLLDDNFAFDDRTETRNIIRDIKSAADDAHNVLSRLREFYRQPDAGQITTADINTIIKDAVRMTSPRWKDQHSAEGKHISVVENLGEIPEFGFDVSQLREAFINIILNAVDAMPDGGEMRISSSNDNGVAQIEICDTGCGMSEETVKRCFEPFYTTKSTGTGLGLAVTYGAIRRHNGNIKVSSEPGRGTRITIRIPTTKVCDGPAITVKPRTALAPIRILIIDDDERSRRVLGRTLQKDGHRVVTAINGAGGMETFRNDKAFDAVVIDRAMPDMSGDAVAVEIRRLAPEMPIIMLTGFGDLMKDRNEKPDGVNIVLGKPATPNELMDAIAGLISGKIIPSGKDLDKISR
jgi:CheY-like chemotaxis protein